jgi:GNAT superfamily N-acetyltransferase
LSLAPPRHAETHSAVLVRPAEPADVALVHGLVGELTAYEKLDHELAVTKDDLAAALFCSAPKVFGEIAEVGGEPAGVAIWFYSFSTFRGRHGIWLEDLLVRPPLRRRGVGTALLARLAAHCRAQGLAWLEWSVLDWNQPSIRFYEKLGARLMHDWTICRLDAGALGALADIRKTRA